MLRSGRVEVTGGFLLMMAVLYYLDDQGVLLLAVTACAIHELGHYLAIYGLGGRVAKLRLSATGAEMVLSAARPLGPGAQLLSALAGPVMNLALALLAAQMGERGYLFAGLNLGLAVFNLLPVAQLDGGRAVYSLITLLWSAYIAERVVRVLSILTTGVLLLAGMALLGMTGANFTLLLMAGWLTVSLKSVKGMKRTK